MQIELTPEQRQVIAFALNLMREKIEFHFDWTDKRIDNLIEKIIPEG